jgi:hypothetical protein
MPASLQIEVAPTIEPISLDVAKLQCRVTISNDDALIGVYIQAARELVEVQLARSFANKGYVQMHDFFPYFSDRSQTMAAPAYYAASPRYATTQWNYSQMVKLMVSPLVSVESIEFIGTDQAPHFLYPALQPWRAKTIYTLGSVIEGSGHAQKVTTIAAQPSGIDGSAKSGTVEPTWPASAPDGDLIWTDEGVASAGDFIVDTNSEPPRLFPMPGGNWPAALNVPNAVRIHFTAGYGAAAMAMFPARAKLLILLLVAHWYQNRESVTEGTLKVIPLQFEELLWSLRVYDFAPTPG